MKALSLFLFGIFFMSVTNWETDFEKAKQTAIQDHKIILLSFSGSDWCGPCIRMHKEIFENDAFKKFADANLILVNADFPRLKKNQLPKELQKQNNHLADLYNPDGTFPLTILLAADGKILRKWDGYPAVSSEEFVNTVKAVVDAAN
jgi:thioredoxin-related protein